MDTRTVNSLALLNALRGVGCVHEHHMSRGRCALWKSQVLVETKHSAFSGQYRGRIHGQFCGRLKGSMPGTYNNQPPTLIKNLSDHTMHPALYTGGVLMGMVGALRHAG